MLAKSGVVLIIARAISAIDVPCSSTRSATYCLAMIHRPKDLNIETRRGSPYHVWNRRIRIKRITTARLVYARLDSTHGMHVAQSLI
jgi:hypothetical protein